MRGIADWQWIFQRNDGPIEVSVALHEGRAYRRRLDANGQTSYATALRVDAPESEWQASDESGVALPLDEPCDAYEPTLVADFGIPKASSPDPCELAVASDPGDPFWGAP
jgi:hypothetical protein